jgi:hypothetical protein
MMSHMTTIEQHPDIAALRMRYEEAAETPTAQITDGLGILAGLYLAISPWIIGFNNLTTLTVNNLITGIVVALLALGFASAYARMHGVAWVTPLIGAWTIIAPWVVAGNADTTKTITSNVIIGGLCVLLGAAVVMMGMRRVRR